MATQPYQLALDRQQETTRETDKSAMMTEARKALARQQSAGYPTQPLNIMGNQQPTPQQRDMATGQMGPALAGAKPQPGPAHATGLAQAAIKAAAPAQRNSAALAVGNPQQEFLQRQQFFQEQQNKRRQFDLQMDQARLAQERQALAQQQMGQDTVPAMLAPGEAVIPQRQTAYLQQQGLLDNALGMSQQALARQYALRQQQANPWNVQRFATGGVVPTTGVTMTQPTLGAQLPATGVQSLPPRPVVGPVTPGQPPPVGGTDFGALNQQISAFGPAPTLDEATMARIRAQESQRLMNIERASLNELGASAASSGALLGGDVRSIAAGFASDRLAAESRLGTDLAVQKLGMEREDYARKFGLAGQLALQREQQGFSAQEAELDRRWRSGEALSEREFAALEAAKQREFQRTERLGTQGFTSQEAELDRRWRSGERLSDQEWQTLERARDRQQQTSERLGAQRFTAQESARQRALITDENAKDRLSQMALQEKQLEAQRANLDAQLEQARSENNLDRVQQLTVQRNQLGFQRQELRQQNDQFLTDFGLRRDVFDRGMVEFDLTRADQVGQFAQNLDLQNRQLLQNLDISRMDDATRRYVADLSDRFNRDLNAATIDPTTLQTILSAAGSLAPILQGLGVSGSDIVGGVRSLFGGGVSPGDFSEANLVFDEAGNIVSSGPAGAASGSGIPWSTVGQAAVGAAGAYALIEAFNDPRSFSRTAQMIAGGAAIGSVLPGVGTLVGAGLSAVAAGIGSAFGPSARTVAKDAFTAEFDKAYQGTIERMLSLPPTDPNSWANPQNRLAFAAAFAPAVQKAAALDVGDVEISDVDWRRMEGLGLAASVQGSDRARFYAIDDPRLIAMMGPGGANQYFTFEVPHQNNDQVYANAQGSLGAFIADGTLTVRDKATGEIIDFNNPEQLKAIAARNNPTGGAA